MDIEENPENFSWGTCDTDGVYISDIGKYTCEDDGTTIQPSDVRRKEGDKTWVLWVCRTCGSEYWI